MIASTFALNATAPPSFPANLQAPPNIKKSLSHSLFNIWQSALEASLAVGYTVPTRRKKLSHYFDASNFISYFEPIPGALNAISDTGMKTLVEPLTDNASSENSTFSLGVYIDVKEDKSFALHIADANGRGIAAHFKRDKDMLRLYTLHSIDQMASFDEVEAPSDFKTVRELENHFHSMIERIDEIIDSRKAPEPNPPGGGVSLTLAA